MRILFVTHEIPAVTGGGIYVFDLVLALKRRGIDVVLWSSAIKDIPQGLRQATILYGGEEIRYWRYVHQAQSELSSTFIPYPSWFCGQKDIDREFGVVLKTESPNVVHFQHFLGQSMNFIEICKKLGIPTVFTLHDLYTFCYMFSPVMADSNDVCTKSESGRNCIKCVKAVYLKQISSNIVSDHEVLKVINKQRNASVAMLRHIDYLHSPSEFLEKRLVSEYEEIMGRINVHPLGIRIPQYEHKSTQNYSTGPLKIGYLGGNLPSKGINLLLDAFLGLEYDAKLLLWGPHMDSYVGRNDIRIENRGFFNREQDIQQVFSEVDVLVQPSLLENYSCVVREAYSFGVPVVASDAGGLPELVKDGITGLVFKNGNVLSLRCVLERIMSERGLLEKLQNSAAKVSVKSVEQEVEEWIVRYANLTANIRKYVSISNSDNTTPYDVSPALQGLTNTPLTDQVLEKLKGYWDVLFSLARKYEREHNINKALSFYQKAIDIAYESSVDKSSKTYCRLCYHYASLNYRVGNTSNVEYYFGLVIKKGSQGNCSKIVSNSYYYLAAMIAEMDYQCAAEYLNKCLNIMPGHLKAKKLLLNLTVNMVN